MIIRKSPKPAKYCNRCESTWIPYIDNPKTCAVCGSPYWNKPRVKAPTVMKIPDEMKILNDTKTPIEPEKAI